MGLDVSHGCWSGAYSAFMRWRAKICEAAGWGDLMSYPGYDMERMLKLAMTKEEDRAPIPHGFPNDDVLTELLNHSDCDGELEWQICGPLADRLEGLLPEIEGDGGGHLGNYKEKTIKFIAGLRLAAERQENVEFH